MKRAPLGVGLFMVMLGGCRALIGIEDLEPEQPGRNDGRNDGGGNGGGNDANGPGPPLPDAGSCLNDPLGCRRCCKERFGAFRDTFERGGGAKCLCDRGGCQAQCATSLCSPIPTDAAPPMPCAECIDPFLGKPGNACEAECKGNPECDLGLDCVQICVANRQ